jgi:hypothetical protein
MKFGVREICDVVLKKKAEGYFGKLWLDKDMPVLYFDTLKTSSLEGAATTVYAQGGRGNPRLVAWEGDRTVTFTMEDALISPESFSILSGAGLIDASSDDKIYVHTTEQVEVKNGTITLDKIPSDKGEFYLMVMTSDGAIDVNALPMKIPSTEIGQTITLSSALTAWASAYSADDRHQDLGFTAGSADSDTYKIPTINDGNVVYVDYYVEAISKVKQINIEASKFGGSYYLEASTLFRDQATGEDLPAEFIIPNCKVQSNFTFTMAPTGDPSTFTFTLDAFPDYTKFDKTKKVIAAIQIIEDNETFGKAPANGQNPTP